jgi:hypothetical protein
MQKLPRHGGMTWQDDNFEALALFAEQAYLVLILKAERDGLSPEEAYLLTIASRVASALHAAGPELRRSGTQGV